MSDGAGGRAAADGAPPVDPALAGGEAEPDLAADPFSDLPPTRVVVVGGGLAGLVVARDTARPGFRVTLVEASDTLGGAIASGTVGGIRVDVGAESIATRGTAVPELIAELGLTDAVVAPNPAGAWLRLADRTVPLPAGGLLGIPSAPLAPDVARAIGWGGALRAWLDRVLPAWGVGRERSLGRLVRRRMGRRVLDSLVEPIAGGVYSADPDLLDVDVVAPGLAHAFTRTGSLSSAVATLRGGARAGSAVLGLDGGIARLVDALADDARARGADLRMGTGVVALERSGASALESTDAAAARVRSDAPAPDLPDESIGPVGPAVAAALPDAAAPWSVLLADGTRIPADAVVVATPGPAALRLLAAASDRLAGLAGESWPEPSTVELITLVIDDEALDAAPRGTGLLVAGAARRGGDAVTAKALTHSTAKWSWLADAAGAHRHVVRLSYGAAGRPPETAALDDDDARALALRDAATLLGIPLAASTVVDAARTRWTNGLPFAAEGQRDRLAAARAALEATPGLEATGAWLSGTGIASVVPDARAAGGRTRALRWKLLTGQAAHPSTTQVGSGADHHHDRSESA